MHGDQRNQRHNGCNKESIAMKYAAVIYAVLTAAIIAPMPGHCGYPSVERAHLLFGAQRVAATNIDMTSCEYGKFYEDLLCHVAADSSRDMETFLISSITSLVVTISTNQVDDGTSRWLLLNRAAGFAAMAQGFSDIKTNSVNCMTIASYLGRVNAVDFPTNEIGSRCSATFFSTDARLVDEWQRNRLHKREAYELQTRVSDANNAVRTYRHELLSICGISVRGCREVMADNEFSSFTNRLVAVSGATELEQKVLFRGVP